MNKNLKIFLFVLFDVLSVFFAVVLGIYLIYIEDGFFRLLFPFWYYFAFAPIFAIFLNIALKLYSNLAKHVGFAECIKVFISGFGLMAYLIMVNFIVSPRIPAWSVLSGFFYIIFLFSSRFMKRFVYFIKNYNRNQLLKRNGKLVMVVGAGSAGDILIRDMKNSKDSHRVPVCAIDDDENKIGQHIEGVKIVGDTTTIVRYSKEYCIDEIIVAMPNVPKKRLSDIVKECKKTRCLVKVLPSMSQLASGKVSIAEIKDVSIQDLLGREQVQVNLDEIMGYIEEKIVLVTGGGGSIGSELCRQIARHNPKQLIIVDIYENNAYDIQMELERNHKNLNLKVLIASVRDSKKVNNIFKEYRPHIVFHAAAHKHVPLMETSPNEAVKNNVSGTFKVADAAGRNGVEKFVLISTDKAVNPTNIMGATKRICEMIVQTMNKKYQTDYVAVRFGNVLGSNGSVIPLFKKQIADGGPVTVTHKDIIRYFMTIPEAVSLVLQAGAYAKGGEIFVLDMGEPVRIYDLAENMIKLSGLEPNVDIDIKITGLRPGEKLYEERLMKEEGLQKTANEKISIGKPLDIDENVLFDKIQELYVEAYNETDRMKELVHELVPTYKIDTRKFNDK